MAKNDKKPFNLFVYGTLTNPSVFRAVLGLRMVMMASDADGVHTVWRTTRFSTATERPAPTTRTCTPCPICWGGSAAT